MRNLGLVGVLIAAATLPGTAAVARDSAPRLAYQPLMAARPGPVGATLGRSVADRIDQRWHGGTRAPGGWAGYRRPSRGHILPHYWANPGFAVGNYWDYGLTAPPAGHGWSRYYDDAVLIDRSGRVYDSVDDVDWRDDDDGDDGMYSYDYDGVTDDGHYRGTWRGAWTGSYDGAPVSRYEGEYSGDYRGTVPHPRIGGLPGGYHQGGYVAGGYYWPAPTVTTVVVHSQPVVTTHYIEESYVAPKKAWAPKRKWKPKPRCACK